MRSWDRTQKATQYYPETPGKEAAKWLRLAAGRFVNDRANLAEVQEAYEALVQAVAPMSQPVSPRPWHYVTERLPEPEQDVLFWSRWQTIYCSVGRLRVTEDVKRFVSANGPHLLGDGRGEAFAWQPLPEPPPLPGGPDA